MGRYYPDRYYDYGYGYPPYFPFRRPFYPFFRPGFGYFEDHSIHSILPSDLHSDISVDFSDHSKVIY